MICDNTKLSSNFYLVQNAFRFHEHFMFVKPSFVQIGDLKQMVCKLIEISLCSNKAIR